MRILVTGSTGFIGSALVPFLRDQGHDVVRLVRRKRGSAEQEVVWNPAQGTIDREGLERLDAVVHLAGANIAKGRWTIRRKQTLWNSRVEGTSLLCNTLGALQNPPKTLVAISAIGYYGDRGDELLDEESPPGTSYLADLCKAWETAARTAEPHGIRVVNPRLGMVLSPTGGPLRPLLHIFRFGLGGRLGTGNAYMSWITLHDALNVIAHCLASETLTGPINTVAPEPPTNRAFTAALGKALHRPTCCTVPAFVLRLALGQLGQELLLASARVIPRRLTESGFTFAHPTIENALHSMLSKP